MKTKNLLFALIAITSFCISSYAQSYFTAASATENGASSSGVVNTGNDRRDFAGISVTLSVNVWDGNTPKLGWDDGVHTPGTIALGNASITDAYDPDVCLVEETGTPTIYAVVVYYSVSNGKYYYQPFRWNNSTYVFTAGTPVSIESASCFTYTINIDGDTYENFAIVYDWKSSCLSTTYDVHCVVGHAGSSAPTLYTCSGSPFTIGSDHAKMPDVALYDGISGNEYIIISYVLTNGTYSGQLEYAYDYFSALTPTTCSTSGFTYPQLGAPTYNYYYPRIAAMNGGNSNMCWTVVVEDHNATKYFIKSYTQTNNSGILSHTYNDGNATDSPYDIRNVPNLRPAVTYDDQDAYIFVGWTFDNLSNTYAYASTGAYKSRYPIVLLCDADGYMVSSTLYWEVPTSVTNNQQKSIISIAGRYDRNYMLYTYYDELSPRIVYKTVSPSATNLRQSFPESVAASDNIYPNPNNGEFTIIYPFDNSKKNSLEIFNMLGEKIYSEYVQSFITGINISLANIPSGVYQYKINNGTEIFNGKFIKQ
jgi:hypothetical protein